MVSQFGKKIIGGAHPEFFLGRIGICQLFTLFGKLFFRIYKVPDNKSTILVSKTDRDV
jgi:hypothetical protein